MSVRKVLIYFLLVLFIGCAPAHLSPVQESEVKQTLLSFLEDGKTTKEEVLLRLGIPSAQFEGERILTYRLRFEYYSEGDETKDTGGVVRKVRKEMVVIAREIDPNDPRLSQWGGERPTIDYLNLILVFDEHHVLQRHSLLRVW